MMKTVLTSGNVLKLFTYDRPELGPTEVAQLLGISKSSASSIMISLAQSGLITHTKNRRYRLSWQIAEMSQIGLGTSELLHEAYQTTRELVKDWKISVYLGRLNRTQVLLIDKIQLNPLVHQLLFQNGPFLPSFQFAIGKVLLAQQDWSQVVNLFEEREKLKNNEPESQPDLCRLKEELEQARLEGFSSEKEEVAPGICSIAAPIYENDGIAKTAIGFALLANQYYQQEVIYNELILKTAQRISERLRLI